MSIPKSFFFLVLPFFGMFNSLERISIMRTICVVWPGQQRSILSNSGRSILSVGNIGLGVSSYEVCCCPKNEWASAEDWVRMVNFKIKCFIRKSYMYSYRHAGRIVLGVVIWNVRSTTVRQREDTRFFLWFEVFFRGEGWPGSVLLWWVKFPCWVHTLIRPITPVSTYVDEVYHAQAWGRWSERVSNQSPISEICAFKPHFPYFQRGS